MFLSAFISSTLAPGGSEAVLAYLASQAQAPLALLLVLASVGNTLGALTTYALGSLAAKKYPLKQHLPLKYQARVSALEKWGVWLLLFSWLPLVGDAFCFAAGWMKTRFVTSLLAIALGKIARYGIIIFLVAF